MHGGEGIGTQESLTQIQNDFAVVWTDQNKILNGSLFHPQNEEILIKILSTDDNIDSENDKKITNAIKDNEFTIRKEREELTKHLNYMFNVHQHTPHLDKIFPPDLRTKIPNLRSAIENYILDEIFLKYYRENEFQKLLAEAANFIDGNGCIKKTNKHEGFNSWMELL